MSETEAGVAAEGAAQPSPADAPAAAQPAPPAAPSWLYTHEGWQERPEGIPEKLWDAEKKAIPVDRLLKAHAEAESALGKRAAEIKELKAKVMTAPDAYQVTIPPDSVLAGQGVTPDHLLVKVISDKLKEANAPQSVFDAVVGGYAEFFEKAQAAQMARLPEAADPVNGGEKVAQRLAAIDQRMQAAVQSVAKGDAGRAQALLSTFRTLMLTAEGVELAEAALAGRLAQAAAPYAASPLGGVSAAGSSPPSLDAARALMASREYQDGDPQTVAKVTAMFAEMYKDVPPPPGANKGGV